MNDLEYYSVNALSRQDVMLFFKIGDNVLAYYAIQRNTGYSIFDINNNQYTGFVESNNKEGYNWFDSNANWIRFLV